MDLSDLKIKKLVIFSQKKIYLAFWETNPPPPPPKKNSLYFRKKKISGNRTFLGNILAPSLKILYFRRELVKPKKQTKKTCSK